MSLRIHFISGEHVDVKGIELEAYDRAASNPEVRIMWALNRIEKPMTIRLDATTYAEELAD